MIKYGLISEVDSRCLEKTMDLIRREFPKDSLEFTEVGIYSGETGSGIKQYFNSIGMASYWTGIDNARDGQEILFMPDNFIKGNSNEVYNQLEDESQHMIVIDANHSFPYVVMDYYCFSPKVKQGGFLCFHDAAPQAQGRGWQLMGDKHDSDMSIAVLKALDRIGLLEKHLCEVLGWEKIFHEWDENDEHGGMIIFKKL